MYAGFRRTKTEPGCFLTNAIDTNVLLLSLLCRSLPSHLLQRFPNFLRVSMVLEGFIANIHISVTEKALEIGEYTSN